MKILNKIYLKRARLIVLSIIIISSTILIIMGNTFAKYKGPVEGTGFIKKELPFVGILPFDIDEKGNIYFAVSGFYYNGIVIYDSAGNYKYTLPQGGEWVKIKNNEMLVGDAKRHLVAVYSLEGYKLNEITYDAYGGDTTYYFGGFTEQTLKKGTITYKNNNGTIIKEEGDKQTVIFTLPPWQRWYYAINLIFGISVALLIILLIVPKVIKGAKGEDEDVNYYRNLYK